MLISFFRFLKGYVRIRLNGYSPERFLNLCRTKNIVIWDLRSSGVTYEMNLSVQDFRRLRPLRKKARAHIEVTGRYGLPFFLYRYRSRKMFPAGILLCALFLYVMSLFIWNIHIEGNYSRTTDVILDYLESESIVHGMAKKKVDCKEIQSMLRIKFPDIIWVSAEVKGTRLIIRVRENMDADLPVKKEEAEGPGDLKASGKGLITSVLVRSGAAEVQAGDEVEKGDLLVRGRIDILNDSAEVTAYRYTAADADVFARTEYEYQDEFLLSHEGRRYTGRKRRGFYMRAGDRSFSFAPKPRFARYTALKTEHPLRITENFYLPLAFGDVVWEEYEICTEKYTEKEAQALAQKRFDEFLESFVQKGVQIVQNNVRIEVGKNMCRASGTVSCLEDIGVFSPVEEELQPGEEDGEENIGKTEENNR